MSGSEDSRRAQPTPTSPQPLLRDILTPAGRDLYDFVLARHPRRGAWMTERRGSACDDAFRMLLQEVTSGAQQPSHWNRLAWPDRDVAKAAADPDVRQRAWRALGDTTAAGWPARLAHRNRVDRFGEWVIYGVGLLILAIVIVL